MIYLTTFDEQTKQAAGPSSDSGFPTIEAAAEILGPGHLTRSSRLLIYPGGVAISDYPFVLTAPSISDNVERSSDNREGS